MKETNLTNTPVQSVHSDRAIKLWWSKLPGIPNFGDELSPIIVQGISHATCDWSPPDVCEMIAVGSLIEFASKVERKKPLVVWGSGFISDGPRLSCRMDADFYAVRGELSLNRVSTRCSHIAVGDPALLLSCLIERKTEPCQVSRIGIFPHFVDRELPELHTVRNDTRYVVIDPLWPVQDVLEAIWSCSFIFSSSLHGLIAADSYEIPNAWLPLSDRVLGGDYKFRDYYSGIGRTLERASLRQAFTPSAVSEMIAQWKPVDALHTRQEDLIASFPGQFLTQV